MSWLQRVRGGASDEDAPEGEEAAATSAVERKSPGLALLFEGLSADGRHAILDLGPASRTRLRLLGRYGRQIRFAGLVPPSTTPSDLGAAAASIPENPDQPYDVVLAWDILDHLADSEREAAVRRLDEVTAPDARLYAVVSAGGAVTVRPMRIDLLDVDRVSQEPVGPPAPAGPELLPAQVEKLLVPFQVVRAISLRVGMREYVARKGGRAGA